MELEILRKTAKELIEVGKQIDIEIRSARQEQSDIINRHPEVIRLNAKINQFVSKKNKNDGSIETVKLLIKIEEEELQASKEKKPAKKKPVKKPPKKKESE